MADAALVYSPLRLAGDSPVYLCDATDLSAGRGFHDTHLPPGYPHALAVLDFIGLGSMRGIVVLNLVCMGAGLFCIATVLRREFGFSRGEVNVICLLSCLSWMWVQLITFPLTELLFFALSSMVLAMLSLAKERPVFQAALYFSIAVILAAAAFYVRTIGAALFVALAISVLEARAVQRLVGYRTVIVLFMVGVGLTALLGYQYRERIASPWYARALSYLTTNRNPLNALEEITWWRVGEIGELTQNISSTAYAPTTPTLPLDSISPHVLSVLILRSVRLATGGMTVVLLVAGLWSRRRHFGPVEAYFLAFVGILMIWPFDDTRFFAPVLPLLLAYCWRGLCSLKIEPLALRRFGVWYTAVYCLFGLVALGDSLRVTYFDRLQPWRECAVYVADLPDWLTAFDRYGGVRPAKIHQSPR